MVLGQCWMDYSTGCQSTENGSAVVFMKSEPWVVHTGISVQTWEWRQLLA